LKEGYESGNSVNSKKQSQCWYWCTRKNMCHVTVKLVNLFQPRELCQRI